MAKPVHGMVKVIGMLVVLASAILPCAASNASSDLIVYEDALNSGWANWSWGTTTGAATSPVYSGSNSLAVTITSAWGGLYLAANQTFAGTPYDTLQFWVNGGSQGGQKIRVMLADGSYTLLTNNAVEIPITAGVWTQVKILLANLGNPGQIGGIVWQDTSGGAQPTFYLDAISFTNQGSPPRLRHHPGQDPILPLTRQRGGTPSVKTSME